MWSFNSWYVPAICHNFLACFAVPWCRSPVPRRTRLRIWQKNRGLLFTNWFILEVIIRLRVTGIREFFTKDNWMWFLGVTEDLSIYFCARWTEAVLVTSIVSIVDSWKFLVSEARMCLISLFSICTHCTSGKPVPVASRNWCDLSLVFISNLFQCCLGCVDLGHLKGNYHVNRGTFGHLCSDRSAWSRVDKKIHKYTKVDAAKRIDRLDINRLDLIGLVVITFD